MMGKITLHFSRRQEEILRGLSIVMIMMHNLFHAYSSVLTESEFNYNIDAINQFFAILPHPGCQYIYDIVSFLGWYGVAVFIFLSGYGLSLKYDPGLCTVDHPRRNTSPGLRPEPDFRLSRFILHNWLKLARLMAIAIAFLLIYRIFSAIAEGNPISWKALVRQALPLSCLNGLTELWISTTPGVYWYFGLAFELYIIYALLVHGRSQYLLWSTTFGCCVLFLYWRINPPFDDPWDFESYLGHNFIRWMLPFASGVWIARKALIPKWLGISFLSVSVVAFLPSLLSVYTWLLSPLFAISIIISLAIISDKIPYWRSVWAWTGRLSAYIFVAHPLIRMFIPFDQPPSFLISILYIIGVYILAILYRYITSRLFR